MNFSLTMRHAIIEDSFAMGGGNNVTFYRLPSALVLMTAESLSLLKEFTTGDSVLRIFE